MLTIFKDFLAARLSFKLSVGVGPQRAYSNTKKRRTPLLLFTAVFCISLGGCSATQFIFFPAKGYLRTPEHLGIQYQQISHQTEDGVTLQSWYLKAQHKPQGIIYFLHGNAENISTHIGSVHWLPAAGYDVFMLDYRGFGKSDGLAKIPLVFSDLNSGFQWVQSHNPNQLPVYIIAQSLGASLAVPFAANPEIRSKISGIAIDAAFANYADVTRHAFSKHWLTWLLQYPAAWWISNPYNPIDFIEQISPVPILIFHSEQDAVIPFHNADLLYKKAAEPKYFFMSKGPHIATFNQSSARDRLLKFMRANATVVESLQ
jgi:fermentation-respiration switch protein FrsA (DUF1100 family)